MLEINTIYNIDALEGLKKLDDNSIDCIITSPPYYQLRNYGVEGQIGLENTVDEYIHKLTSIFEEAYRVLKIHGTMWIVIGDSYNGDKKGITDRKAAKNINREVTKTRGRWKRKTLLQIPFRLSIELIEKGWILRNHIIWQKPNAMPQSVKDRFTVDFENVFLFTKSEKYYFNQLKEPMKQTGKYGFVNKLDHLRQYNRTIGAKKQDLVGRADYYGFNNRYVPSKDGQRNKRAVWSIPTMPNKTNHFATFPEPLVENMIESGCKLGGVVLDMFNGTGTTCKVAKRLDCDYIGFELNAEYVDISIKKISEQPRQVKIEL